MLKGSGRHRHHEQSFNGLPLITRGHQRTREETRGHLRGGRTDLKAYLFDLLAGVLLLEKLQMKLLLLLLIKLLQMLLQTHRIRNMNVQVCNIAPYIILIIIIQMLLHFYLSSINLDI